MSSVEYKAFVEAVLRHFEWRAWMSIARRRRLQFASIIRAGHGHCPRGCEKPQPGRYDAGPALICGVCWFDCKPRRRSEIVPCALGICD